MGCRHLREWRKAQDQLYIQIGAWKAHYTDGAVCCSYTNRKVFDHLLDKLAELREEIFNFETWIRIEYAKVCPGISPVQLASDSEIE